MSYCQKTWTEEDNCNSEVDRDSSHNCLDKEDMNLEDSHFAVLVEEEDTNNLHMEDSNGHLLVSSLPEVCHGSVLLTSLAIDHVDGHHNDHHGDFDGRHIYVHYFSLRFS